MMHDRGNAAITRAWECSARGEGDSMGICPLHRHPWLWLHQSFAVPPPSHPGWQELGRDSASLRLDMW